MDSSTHESSLIGCQVPSDRRLPRDPDLYRDAPGDPATCRDIRLAFTHAAAPHNTIYINSIQLQCSARDRPQAQYLWKSPSGHRSGSKLQEQAVVIAEQQPCLCFGSNANCYSSTQHYLAGTTQACWQQPVHKPKKPASAKVHSLLIPIRLYTGAPHHQWTRGSNLKPHWRHGLELQLDN